MKVTRRRIFFSFPLKFNSSSFRLVSTGRSYFKLSCSDLLDQTYVFWTCSTCSMAMSTSYTSTIRSTQYISSDNSYSRCSKSVFSSSTFFRSFCKSSEILIFIGFKTSFILFALLTPLHIIYTYILNLNYYLSQCYLQMVKFTCTRLQVENHHHTLTCCHF